MGGFVFLETWGLGSTSLSEISKKTLMNINNINKTQFPVYIYIHLSGVMI